MDFYNKSVECSNLIDEIILDFNTINAELNKSWEGPAAIKFFSNKNDIVEDLNKIDFKIMLLLVIGGHVKELEKITESLDSKLKTKDGLTEVDNTIEHEIFALKSNKVQIIKRINEYLDDLSNDNFLSLSTIGFKDYSLLSDNSYVHPFIKNMSFNDTRIVEKADDVSSLESETTKINNSKNKESNNPEPSNVSSTNNTKDTKGKEISNSDTKINNTDNNNSLKFTEYKITNYNGASHKGMDFAMPVGTPIQSTINGKVVRVATLTNSDGSYRSYGKFVVVQDNDGNNHYYAHLNGFNCKQNDIVERGTVIGYSGNTGNSTGPHLHYEVRTGNAYDKQIDPRNYLY